jgi:hypothetical protein
MYFHEERDAIEREIDNEISDKYYKDYIVYHKNEKNANEARIINGDIQYYPLGVLNTHPSGIDITFESKDYRFRASALIRAFRVENDITSKVTGVQYKNGKNVKEYIDDRSTYVYNALFSQFNIFDGFSVKWVDDQPINISSIEVKLRHNVFKTDKDGHKDKSNPDNRLWSFSVKEGQKQQQ